MCKHGISLVMKPRCDFFFIWKYLYSYNLNRHNEANPQQTTLIHNSLFQAHLRPLFFPGLLQASLVTAYTTYLTWSGLSHEPDELCNPRGFLISGYDEMIGMSLQSIVSSVFMFVMLICSSFRTALSAAKLSKATC